MKVRSLAAAALAGALLVTGCSSEAETADTSDVTRSLLAQPASDGRSTPLAVDPALAPDDGARVAVSSVGFNRGLVEAPVKVVEMSDYGCSYCRQFHQESFPTIRAQFIETGMVEWKFIPFVTGMFGNSLAVTEAAECTLTQSPAAFEALNERLWNEQAAWKGSDDAEGMVRGWVEQLDVDLDAFDACLADDDRLPRVAASTTLARQIGVRGTPTFIVLGYPPLQGALPLEMWQQILSAVHRDATQNQNSGSEDGANPGGSGG